MRVLTSQIDGTINHVYEDGSEFRLAQRQDHDTIYLSSHTGCALSCKQCHLTSTGQTTMLPLSKGDMVERAKVLFNLRKRSDVPVYFAYMARGDALANREVSGETVLNLLTVPGSTPCIAKVTISTIFPKGIVGYEVDKFLFERFSIFEPTLYWSFYTPDLPRLREWMPEAQSPSIVAEGLGKWQKVTGNMIIVHFPIIEGVNDRLWDHHEMVGLLSANNLLYAVNIVRYNPPDNRSKEAEDYRRQAILNIWQEASGGRAKVQERIGFDVSASCGTFFNTKEG